MPVVFAHVSSYKLRLYLTSVVTSPNMHQPPTFLHDIPSLHEKNPQVPAVLANLDLNRRVSEGDELDYGQVEHSKAIVKALKSHHGKRALRSCLA